jgi:hypothetical protein
MTFHPQLALFTFFSLLHSSTMTRKFCKLGEAQFHFDSQLYIKRLEKFPKFIWRAPDAHKYRGYYTSFSSVCVSYPYFEGPSQFEGVHVITTLLQCIHIVYVHDRICLVVLWWAKAMGGGHPQNRLIYHLVLTLKGPYHFEGVCMCM